jgi:hypothetical protein
MYRQNTFICLVLKALLASITFSTMRCAVQQNPEGGKKDTLAPLLTNSTPEQRSTLFNGNEIKLEFNEYIDIDPNLKQQLLITPSYDTYTFKPIKKGIRILLEEPLKANTTYTFSFQKGIRDLNEKNPAQQLKLVFSTGTYLDSLAIVGRIVDLEKNKVLPNAIVSLYDKNDTLKVEKHKPQYFTKSNEKGIFYLENIKKGKYEVFAFTDPNNSLTYQEKKEKIGFLPNFIQLDSSIQSLQLNLVSYDSTPPRSLSKGPEGPYYQVEWNEGLLNAKLLSDSTLIGLQLLHTSPTFLRFYNLKSRFDSLAVKVMVKDSFENATLQELKIKFAQPKKDRKGKEEALNKAPWEVKPSLPKGEKIRENLQLQIIFSKPIAQYDTSRWHFLADTISRIPITNKDYKWNDDKTQLKIDKFIRFTSILRVQLDSMAFISLENDRSSKLVLDYVKKKADEFGSISGEVKLKTKIPFVVQLLTEDLKVVDEVANQTKFKFSYLSPNKYLLRVLLDKNGNGKWDRGNFSLRQLPETFIYRLDIIQLRQDFDYENQDIIDTGTN